MKGVKISDHQQSMARPIPRIYFIPPTLLVVADFGQIIVKEGIGSPKMRIKELSERSILEEI